MFFLLHFLLENWALVSTLGPVVMQRSTAAASHTMVASSICLLNTQHRAGGTIADDENTAKPDGHNRPDITALVDWA